MKIKFYQLPKDERQSILDRLEAAIKSYDLNNVQYKYYSTQANHYKSIMDSAKSRVDEIHNTFDFE